jgi:hypothetical protein
VKKKEERGKQREGETERESDGWRGIGRERPIWGEGRSQ